MGKKYNQLKIDERGMIAVLRAEEKSAREIGRARNIYEEMMQTSPLLEW